MPWRACLVKPNYNHGMIQFLRRLRMSHHCWLSALGVASLTLAVSAGGTALKYPATKRGDQVDIYHGTKVADPYRWLEADVRDSKDVADWVAAENKVTFAYLSAIPEREAIKKRVTDLWNYEKLTPPFRAGPRYVFTKNNGLQNQAVYYTLETLDAEPKLLLDPNMWSKDGTVALALKAFTRDGKLMAYAVSEAGSDWHTWKVLDVESRKNLDDEVRWSKFSMAAWTKDNKGFFYSRFPEAKPGEKFQGLPLNMKLFYHRLGTPQADDTLVYERPDQPTWTVYGMVTDDGRYLVIEIGDGTTSRKTRVLYKDLADPAAKPVALIDDFDAVNDVIGNEGTTLYVRTDRDAPRGRIIGIDLREPAREHWQTVMPQGKATLELAHFVGGRLICEYLKDARSLVKLYKSDGTLVRELSLPGIGSARGFVGRSEDTDTFYTFDSFNSPGRIYRLDLATAESKLFREPKVRFNPDDYEVTQIFYRSADGTMIPMFISHKRGLKHDGSTPTLLYGYGGFNISMTPKFSVGDLAWMEMGGIYAVANIRGGGEYGREWHRAATRLNRPRAYEDFIAAAETLIKAGYTRPDKLAIHGHSNGGLLVGAVMCKRPDLFGATLPGVGVMDVLRFHKFTAGRFWVDDYGSSDNPEEFKVQLTYSPYHNLKEGVRYPATLVTTADHDDRVVPSHSFKFAAQLQHCQAGDAPVLIRIETRAGHGAGRPTAMVIEEVADQWAFLARNLKMNLPSEYR
jgi:prolyl oligopeptidase